MGNMRSSSADQATQLRSPTSAMYMIGMVFWTLSDLPATGGHMQPLSMFIALRVTTAQNAGASRCLQAKVTEREWREGSEKADWWISNDTTGKLAASTQLFGEHKSTTIIDSPGLVTYRRLPAWIRWGMRVSVSQNVVGMQWERSAPSEARKLHLNGRRFMALAVRLMSTM